VVKVLILANSNLSLCPIFELFRSRGHSVFWGVFESPVYLALLKLYPSESVIFKEDPIVFNPSALGNKYRYTNPGLPESHFLKLLNPDIVITDVSTRLARVPKGRELRVNIFHSFCFKEYVFHISNATFDLLLLPSAWWVEKFSQFFRGLDSPLLVDTGYYKHQSIMQNRTGTPREANRLIVTEQKRFVLYAPSWGGGEMRWGNLLWPRWDEQLALYYLGLVLAELKKFDAVLILKRHHLADKIDPYRLEGFDNLFVIQDSQEFFEDPIEYIAAADLLISDVSGIIFEYGITGRPIIVIDPDNPLVWQNSSIPKDYLPTAPIVEFEELIQRVREVLGSKTPEAKLNYSHKFLSLYGASSSSLILDNVYTAIFEAFHERHEQTG
jgi:hypothetical protein